MCSLVSPPFEAGAQRVACRSDLKGEGAGACTVPAQCAQQRNSPASLGPGGPIAPPRHLMLRGQTSTLRNHFGAGMAPGVLAYALPEAAAVQWCYEGGAHVAKLSHRSSRCPGVASPGPSNSSTGRTAACRDCLYPRIIRRIP